MFDHRSAELFFVPDDDFDYPEEIVGLELESRQDPWESVTRVIRKQHKLQATR